MRAGQLRIALVACPKTWCPWCLGGSSVFPSLRGWGWDSRADAIRSTASAIRRSSNAINSVSSDRLIVTKCRRLNSAEIHRTSKTITTAETANNTPGGKEKIECRNCMGKASRVGNVERTIECAMAQHEQGGEVSGSGKVCQGGESKLRDVLLIPSRGRVAYTGGINAFEEAL
jgi:hypothetical protein